LERPRAAQWSRSLRGPIFSIAIDIPEDIARQLSEKWGSLSRGALEAIAIEGYRSGALSQAQVQRILGHSSRWETDAFLKKTKVFLDYT
jgi:hypothetical protein